MIEAELFEGDIDEDPTVSKRSRYNTRNKPRIDYKKLNEGNILGNASAKVKKKFQYAWDTPECSEDDDFLYEPKLPFETWCQNQPNFFQKTSIFLCLYSNKK